MQHQQRRTGAHLTEVNPAAFHADKAANFIMRHLFKPVDGWHVLPLQVSQPGPGCRSASLIVPGDNAVHFGDAFFLVGEHPGLHSTDGQGDTLPSGPDRQYFCNAHHIEGG